MRPSRAVSIRMSVRTAKDRSTGTKARPVENGGCDPELSVIVACYQEGEHLHHSLPALERVLAASGRRYEMIVIDDASTDDTPRILERMLGGREDVILRMHERNQGRGATIQEGLYLARGEIAGYLDIDLEVGPWYILPAIDAIERHDADVVVARRVYKLRIHPFVLARHVLSIGFRTLSHAMIRLPIRDSEAGFKFFRRRAILPVLEQCRDRHWFWDTEIVYRAHRSGLKVVEFPCLFIRRPEKTSTVRVLPDMMRHMAGLSGLWWRGRRR